MSADENPSADDHAPDSIAAHLLQCEQTLLDPAARRDRARVSAFLADDFVEFGASGRIWTREQILDQLATEDYTPPAMLDFRCRIIAPGVALVCYQTKRLDAASGRRAATLRSSLWTKESGEWLIRFHQGTRALE
jgi:hypothetical protein